MLEQPKKSGGKLVSHILASHGGDETEINFVIDDLLYCWQLLMLVNLLFF